MQRKNEKNHEIAKCLTEIFDVESLYFSQSHKIYPIRKSFQIKKQKAS